MFDEDVNLNKLTRLVSIGYVVVDGPFNGISAPGSQVNRLGRPKCASSLSHERLRHMNGRLDNLDLMGRAIDELDGSFHEGPDRIGDEDGRRQIRHLLAGDTIEARATGLLYVALRRHQRTGRSAALRTGLTLLLAHDMGEISGTDALSSVWPEALDETTGEIAMLDARIHALSSRDELSSAA